MNLARIYPWGLAECESVDYKANFSLFFGSFTLFTTPQNYESQEERQALLHEGSGTTATDADVAKTLALLTPAV